MPAASTAELEPGINRKGSGEGQMDVRTDTKCMVGQG